MMDFWYLLNWTVWLMVRVTITFWTVPLSWITLIKAYRFPYVWSAIGQHCECRNYSADWKAIVEREVEKNEIEIEIEKALNAFEQLKTPVKWNKQSRGYYFMRSVYSIITIIMATVCHSPYLNNTNERKTVDQEHKRRRWKKRTVRKSAKHEEIQLNHLDYGEPKWHQLNGCNH